jgi:hypothetical protein
MFSGFPDGDDGEQLPQISHVHSFAD